MADGGGASPGARPGPDSSALLAAALGYAARGWPVFPCNPKNKQPLLGADKDAANKPIRGTGGLKKASTDPEQIAGWWKRWPGACIGLCPGHPTKGTETAEQPAGLTLLCLDFDPRTDPDTGEVFDLRRLKSETEAQLGCTLPESLAVLTPSDGVHLYLLVGDTGPPIGNRGNLPDHVDVRGLGGYVIAPPSVLSDGRRYRLHRKEPIGGIAKAPERLLEVLRERKGAPAETSTDPAKVNQRPKSQLKLVSSTDVDDAVRKYALAALDGELQEVRRAPSGRRNPQLNESALKIASLVAAGAIEATLARLALESAARDNPGRDDDRQLLATIDSGWSAGLANPRDLSEIAAAARERSDRRGRPSSSHPPLGQSTGRQSSQAGGAAFEAEERGGGGGPQRTGAELTRACAFLPHTDLGNLERFLARYGDDFLYVEAWGWLAWDGRRWNRDMAVPLLGRAVQQTMRAIQEEAKFVRESGWKRDSAPLLHKPDERDEGLDYIAKWKGKEPISFSATIAAWGRTSEGAGHINCIAKLAEARLAALPAEFDADPLLLNVANGTIVYLRPDPERGLKADWSIREHRREDRSTKVCGVAHDSTARCPRFDVFLAKVQPDPEMRDFLDIWAGYNSLGLSDAQKFALFYGEGSNGKGVWVNTVAHVLGDYAWATGIETFIDQGRYRKGSDATPDLAALAGRRMVYANEPEEGSKFSDGLIKALTSDEPKGGVRENFMSPFELQITFTNTVMANNLPSIGTDHGIQRRVQVVPWDVIIPDEEQDLRLKDKLKAEGPGILNRVIAGAVAYLNAGLPKPEAITAATVEYQQDNDLLGKFVQLVVARVPGEEVGARPLHRVFAAWQTWAGQLAASGKPWSEKYLNKQLRKKKFAIGKSSTMKWRDIALRFEANAFCEHDADGRILRAVEADLPEPKRFAGELAPGGADAQPPPHPPDPHPESRGPDDVIW